MVDFPDAQGKMCDAIERDILPAKSIWMEAIWFNPQGMKPVGQSQLRVISQLTELVP